jgi:hypothetical protein
MATLLMHGEREDRSLAPILTSMLLAPRSVLVRSDNGRNPIPSNTIAASRRASIVSRKADPFGYLVAISECDLRDGCLRDDVTAPYRQLVAHLECLSNGLTHADDRPLFLRIQREQKAQHRADDTEIRVAANQNDAIALTDAIRESNRHIAALEAFRDGCEVQLARVRLASRQMALT